MTSLDPKTGEVMSQGRLKGAVDNYFASPVAADAKIFMVSELGKVAVLKPGGAIEVLAVNDVEDLVYATPPSTAAASTFVPEARSIASGSNRGLRLAVLLLVLLLSGARAARDYCDDRARDTVSDRLSRQWTAYVPVGGRSAAYGALAAPVSGRLFFAGEATIRDYPATVHGAHLSGLRRGEADRRPRVVRAAPPGARAVLGPPSPAVLTQGPLAPSPPL